MQLPITIGLYRSRILDALILLFALVASGITAAFPAQIPVQMALLLVVWLVTALAWQHLSPRIAQLRLEQNGEISVRCLNGEGFEVAHVQLGATVHPWLTVFCLKTNDVGSYTVIVTVDSLKAENFRRLRVFLRWRADFSVPDDDA